MVREMVQEMHLHKVDIQFVNKMLCNFWLDLDFIFINATMICRHRNIFPSGVTLPFLLLVQHKLLFLAFPVLLCRSTGVELTEHIHLMVKLFQMNLHVLDRGFSTMVPVVCHKVKMNGFLVAQQGFCEGNPLAHCKVKKNPPETWNNHAPECFPILTTPLRLWAIWLVGWSEARICNYHRPAVVELVDPGMLLKDGQYPVQEMLKGTEIDGPKNIRYDNSHQGDAFHIPEDTFWGFNYSIFQILSSFLLVWLISLSCDYYFVEV